jgi:hypothetical protein
MKDMPDQGDRGGDQRGAGPEHPLSTDTNAPPQAEDPTPQDISVQITVPTN